MVFGKAEGMGKKGKACQSHMHEWARIFTVSKSNELYFDVIYQQNLHCNSPMDLEYINENCKAMI